MTEVETEVMIEVEIEAPICFDGGREGESDREAAVEMLRDSSSDKGPQWHRA